MPKKFSRLRGRTFFSAALILSCTCLFAVALSACGSSGSSSTSQESTESTEASGGNSETTSESGGALAAVAEEVAEQEEEPTEIPQAGHPMKKTPPTGKKVVDVDCGVQACHEVSEGVEAAAKALGWTYKKILGGTTPAEITSAWNQVVAEKPDFVISSGLPTALFEKQLGELEASGAIFQNIEAAEPENTPGNALAEKAGNLWAQWIAVDSNCEATVQYVTVPEFPILEYNENGLKEELEKLCPEAGLKTTKVTAAELGKELPSQVVSVLQKEPDTNYVVLGFGDMSIGVPEALTAAHLETKIVTATLSSAVLQYVKNGEVAMGVARAQSPDGWIAVEGALRQYNKEPFFEEQELGPTQILTEANVPEDAEKSYNFPANYEEQYEEQWGLK